MTFVHLIHHLTIYSLNSYNNYNKPIFYVEKIGNVTVIAGNTAKLHCAIKLVKKQTLHKYLFDQIRVAWLKLESQTIISFQQNLIVRNSRMNITANDLGNVWTLIIRSVTPKDDGFYMCQINSDPPSKSAGYLEILTHPKIIDRLTSNETIVSEYSNILLRCEATGNPPPNISWAKFHNLYQFTHKQKFIDSTISHKKNAIFNSANSNMLILNNITRFQAGIYVCLADNGIPPAVSRQISVNVNCK
ncbi:unnamed protein product [Gordionus sp. m RMFG-2023]|uniref:lachesin-like n=1 Tax=Gordionus sp. m RMFG-2023 TaxID=3053472 RepID=UPI0030E1E486